MQITFMKDMKCQDVCTKTYTKDKNDQARLDFLRKGIQQNYQHHWLVNNKLMSCYLYNV